MSYIPKVNFVRANYGLSNFVRANYGSYRTLFEKKKFFFFYHLAENWRGLGSGTCTLSRA